MMFEFSEQAIYINMISTMNAILYEMNNTH